MNNWEQILSNHKESNFLQSEKWQKVQEKIGEKTIVHFYDNALCLMIVRNARRGRYLEIPGGPIVNWNNPSQVQEVLDDIKSVAKAEKCVFIRLRPQLEKSDKNQKLFSSLGFRPSPMHLAAEHTVILDLTKSEDELLANMRRQTRYEVKRAIKQNIEITSDNSIELFKEFHKIQSETAKRQNFIPPSLPLLLAERESFGDSAQIFVAKTSQDSEEGSPISYKSGAPIAYGLILAHGEEADYYEAASTELNRTLPGAYALQWQVIRTMKSLGYTRYNLWGIAPIDASTGKPQINHRYSKVTTFKTGFGGQIVEYIPAQDYVIDKIAYLKNLTIETIRKKKRHL